MAKGRRLTSSRSEMFLGSLAYNPAGGGAAGSPELGEDEVWSMVDGALAGEINSGDGGAVAVAGDWISRATSGYMSRPRPARRSGHRQVGGLSLAFDDDTGMGGASSPSIVHQIRSKDGMAESPRGRHLATSAPVNVPDWSKIYRVDSVESLHDSDDGLIDDSELIPPHEYLARKMAANSVFEGVGRTLKGRDLSRVRDAVWSQTGFDG